MSRRCPRAGALLLSAALAIPIQAQLPSGPARSAATAKHVIIPSLANATRPSDLDFEAGECDLDESGAAMDCLFQQVFLTVALFDANLCLVTTNRYERRFVKQNDGSWLSQEGPEGDCGVTDVAILRREGEGARWTMELRKASTRTDLAACRGLDTQPEILSWQNVRRTLPCKYVEPGAMSR